MSSTRRSRPISLCFALLLTACGPSEPVRPIPSVPSVPVDLLAALADPLAPARRLPGTAHLVSSRTPEDPAGLYNEDHSHPLRVEGDRWVVADERGPGAMTRLWWTAGPMPESAPSYRIHVVVDGEEIGGEGGVTIGELTSGAIEGLPYPWALDDARSSGGFVLAVPIAYRESLRVDIEPGAGGWLYWQIDVRRMPEAILAPFDPSGAAHREALAAAEALWARHEHPGELVVDETSVLAPSATLTREIEGEGALTEIAIAGSLTARAALRVRVETDGEVSVDAPLRWLAGVGSPSLAYDSALSSSDESRTALYYPVPFGTRVTVTLANEGEAEAALGLRVRAFETALDEDVGALLARCDAQVVDQPSSICEQRSEARYPNTVLGEVTGARGQYVGQSIVAFAPEIFWWMLEGDQEVFVDGEPALLGTGMEDYFGGAFYFRLGPFHQPLTGASGFGDVPGGWAIHVYRHHLADTIPFERELRFEQETYIDGARYEGCSFFYVFPER